MAAAVGRGRSRGIRGGRSSGAPAISSPIPSVTRPPSENSSQISQPDSRVLVPDLGANGPNLGASVPDSALDRLEQVAKLCVKQLREQDTDCYSECLSMLQETLNSSETCSKWIELCVSDVSGEFLLSQRLIQFLAYIQTSQSISHYKEVIASTLRFMNLQMNRLKPENPATMSEDQSEKFAAFAVLLAEVSLNITRHDGQPLPSLTWVVLTDCLHTLAQPGLPHKVYQAIHHVLVRYSEKLQQHLEQLGPDRMLQVELLFDKIRTVVIEDSTLDRSRLLLLELIERKAHQHNMPQELLNYYSNHSTSLSRS